jgi:hypothetical protein
MERRAAEGKPIGACTTMSASPGARAPARKDIARLRGAQLQSAPLWHFEKMDQAAPTRKV